jgi:hypothetical protein
MNLNQSTIRTALFSACLGLTAQAAPFMAVGDNAELFVTAAGTIQSDDNIFLNSANQKSDTIYSFTPGVDLVFGKGSQTTGNVFYKEEIRRYGSDTNQNTQLANVGVNSAFSNGVTKADFNASYAQVAQNDNNINPVGSIVHRNLTDLAGKTEFTLTEKSTIGVGLTYDRTDYGPVTYTDSSIWTIPVDVYFKSNPKLDWSLGYRYRNTSLSGAALDSTDNTLNIGARGEFTPKLTGQVRFGYTRRSFNGGGSQDLLSFDSDLKFLFTEKTDARIYFSNDFGSSGFGDSTKQLTLGFSVNNKLTEQWYANWGLSYQNFEYPTRTDHYLQGQAAVTYVYNAVLNFGASYTYRNNDSTVASAKFTNNVFSIGANVRY